MEEREASVQHFLDLIKRSRRGRFKIYIGMIAGVGKSYRMLQEAHEMLDNGIDVQIGYIETHGRAGTTALLEGLSKTYVCHRCIGCYDCIAGSAVYSEPSDFDGHTQRQDASEQGKRKERTFENICR